MGSVQSVYGIVKLLHLRILLKGKQKLWFYLCMTCSTHPNPLVSYCKDY